MHVVQPTMATVIATMAVIVMRRRCIKQIQLVQPNSKFQGPTPTTTTHAAAIQIPVNLFSFFFFVLFLLFCGVDR